MADELLKGRILGWLERRQLAICEIADARQVGPVDRPLSHSNNMPPLALRERRCQVLELTGKVLMNEKYIHGLPSERRTSGWGADCHRDAHDVTPSVDESSAVGVKSDKIEIWPSFQGIEIWAAA